MKEFNFKVLPVKNNFIFIVCVFVALVLECYAYKFKKEDAALWSSIFRIMTWVVMGIWYYQQQKKHFTQTQKLFLLSNLLPIFVALSSYFIVEQKAMLINILINLVVFVLWIVVFKRMGTRISLKESKNTFKKVLPIVFIFSFFYFFFSLYPKLSNIYSTLIFCYLVVISYAGILSGFLLRNDKTTYITLGIILWIFSNLMESHYIFLLKSPDSYPIIRVIAVISRCFMIYGMIHYAEKSFMSLAEED